MIQFHALRSKDDDKDKDAGQGGYVRAKWRTVSNTSRTRTVAYWRSLCLAALKAELEAVNAKIMALFRKRDAAVLSKMYTEDCSMMPAGSDVVKGRDGKCILC